MKLKRKKIQPPCPQDSVVKKQAERIEELRKENERLTSQLEEYRSREKEIADTVAFAKQKQEEYLADLRVRYALENERLKRFCRTMESYSTREELLRAYDESFTAVKKAREELNRVLQEDLGAGASDYFSERDRLGDESDLPFSTKEQIVRSDLSKVDSIT